MYKLSIFSVLVGRFDCVTKLVSMAGQNHFIILIPPPELEYFLQNGKTTVTMTSNYND